MALEGTFFYKLMDDPLVFVIASGWTFSSGLSVCLQESKGRPCRVLVSCYWHVPVDLKDFENFKKKADPKYRHMLVTYLCNTQADVDLLTSRGIDALFIHQNAFIDERIFKVSPGVEKKYAAVHNANTNVKNFKRHHLAWGVPRVALITYASEDLHSVAEIAGYKDLAYVNMGPNGKTQHLMADGVSKVVNEARCGLILSAVEGANFASTEYLLCGIPVVSTPSVGGRDEFFDPRHVKIVEPTPEAVEKAVAEWGENAPPPEETRASALNKARMFRARLLHWLSAISGQDLFATADENLWSPLFIDKLRVWVTVPPYAFPESQDRPKPFFLFGWAERIYHSAGKLFKQARS